MKPLETTSKWIEKILNHPGFAAIANHEVIKFPDGYLQTFKGKPGGANVFVYLYQPIILEPNCLEEIEQMREYTNEKPESEYSLEQEVEFVGEYILSIVRRKKDFRLVMADLRQIRIFNSDGKFKTKYRNTKLISGVIQLLFDQEYFLETDDQGNQISMVAIMHAFQEQFAISSLQPLYRNPKACAEYADLKVPIIGILQREKSKNIQPLYKPKP